MMKHYLCTICVKLRQPMEGQDDTGVVTAVGYYRNFGVGAPSERAAFSLVSESVDDGEIDWNDSSCKEIDLKYFDEKITANCNDPNKETIWYRSGCSFFPDETTEI